MIDNQTVQLAAVVICGVVGIVTLGLVLGYLLHSIFQKM